MVVRRGRFVRRIVVIVGNLHHSARRSSHGVWHCGMLAVRQSAPMDIVFTRHAQEKFALLREHGVHVAEELVRDTVLHPDVVDSVRAPLRIAQVMLDATHVLRVVYRTEGDRHIVITFYPGRKRNYGKRKAA